MFFWDPTFILLIPAMILALYAQNKVKSTFAAMSRVRTRRGISGAEVAHSILSSNGLSHVTVESQPGHLTDHYDPRSKRVRLSEQVYAGRSVAALGVAAHEVGHALQDKAGFYPMRIRHGLLGPAQLGSTLAWPLALVGLIFGNPRLLDIGILLFSGVVLFHVITLPVELDASKRALRHLASTGILNESELPGARKVLNAAALTYLAAAAVAVMNLIRLLILREARD